MMKIIRKIAITMMCFLCVATLPVHAETLYTISLTGKRHYVMAYEILNLVNQERRNVGASALKMDKNQLEGAMVRAAEIAVVYSHTRPNGESCFSILPKPSGSSSRSENIEIGGYTAESAVSGWMGSQPHKEAILNTKYVSTGIGVFECNGNFFWTEFFSTESAVAPSSTNDQTTSQSISVSGSSGGLMTLESPYTTLAISQSVEAKVSIKSYTKVVYVDTSRFNWSSSNSNIASVSSSGIITANSPGTAVITATVKNSTISKTLTITVDNGIILNSENFPDANFRSYLSSRDKDGNGSLSELERRDVTYITLSNYSNLKSIQGIEFFPNLQTLEISGSTNVESISIDGFTDLKELILQSDNIKSITIRNCPSLTRVVCSYNDEQESLIIENCISLITLRAELSPKLKTVQLRNLNVLNYCEIWSTAVTEIDVSKCALINKAVQNGRYSTIGNVYYENRVHGNYTDDIAIFQPHKDVVVKTSGERRYKNGELIGAPKNGLIKDNDGIWRLYSNDVLRSEYTGLYPYGSSLFYLNKGVLDRTYEGIEYYQKAPYYVVNGQVTYNYTGLGEYKGSLHYFSNSVKDESFNGIAYYKGVPYFVVNGKVTYNYTGLGEYKGSLHYFTNSRKDTSFTGISYYNGEPYYVLDGIVSYQYNGLGKYKDDWWYIVNSKVDKSFSGTYKWKNSTYTIKNGKMIKRVKNY